MHYLYRYGCILNVFFYICIWIIVCDKEFIIIIIIIIKVFQRMTTEKNIVVKAEICIKLSTTIKRPLSTILYLVLQ